MSVARQYQSPLAAWYWSSRTASTNPSSAALDDKRPGTATATKRSSASVKAAKRCVRVKAAIALCPADGAREGRHDDPRCAARGHGRAMPTA